MAACLYDQDGGFFATGPLRSVKEGDFLTSPEVSPWFGRTLAEFVRREAERAGGAGGFLVVDVGAGSGSLLKSLMSHLASPTGGRDHGLTPLPAVRAGLPPEGEQRARDHGLTPLPALTSRTPP